MPWTPDDFISGWVEDGVNVQFPIASLANHNLTAANADGATGDARQVMLSLIGRMFEFLNEEATPPLAVTMKLRPKSVSGSGDFAGKMPMTYELTGQTNFPDGTVADEPVSS